MTAANPAARAAPARAEFPRAPAEGWLTLGLLMAMLLILAWAVDDARWAGVGAGNQSQTGFLTWAVVLGALWGFVSAKSTLPALAAHALGAILATVFLIVAVSGVLLEDPDLPARVEALNESLRRFHHDLFVEGIRSRETTVFLLGIGAVAWATGHFAAFSIFRRRRTFDALFVTALLMLAQVSLTILAQYSYLIAFSAAALLLVVKMNLVDQRQGWLRRHISDNGDVSALYMRSGLTFVAIALIGSVFLAATASSAPLARLWRNADRDLVRWGNELNRIVGGVSGAAKGPGGLFGTSQTIRGVWESSDAPVLRAASNTGEGLYWRAATYDAFDGNTWLQLDRAAPVQVAAGQPLLAPTREAVAPGRGLRTVELNVTALDLGGDLLLTPEAPLSVDRGANVFTNTPGGPLAAIESVEPLNSGDSYRVAALVRVEGEGNGGLTANQLAAAGVSYPAWTRRYVQIRPNSVGDLTYRVADEIVAGLPRDKRNPYHIAEAVQDYLYSTGGFRYSNDVRGLCGGEKLVDCFLRTKIGYCEYFATGMAMLLRTQQIPARVAMGYLPGRQLADGTWEVNRGAAHAWVEVYFPRYGWIRFDPTPGNQENNQRPTRLEAGTPVATPQAGDAGADRPSPNFDREDPGDPAQGAREAPTAAPGTPAPAPASGDGGPFAVLVPLGLVLLAAVLVLLAWTRSAPVPEPDVAYRGVVRIAGRFGYGPRPTQTAYEYAAVLGELLPRVRKDLEVVARAKVHATYAPPSVATAAIEGLREAYRRVRIGLLRLAVRRVRAVRFSLPRSVRARR